MAITTSTSSTQTAETPDTRPPSMTYAERWQMIGGERLYTIMRWLIVLLLFAIIGPLGDQQIWPVSLTSDPVVLVLYGYAAFCLLMTLVLVLPPLYGVFGIAYFLDIVFLSALTLLGGEQRALILPLYMLPVISIAITYDALIGSLAGLFSAILYAVAFFVGPSLLGNVPPDPQELQTLDYLAIALPGFVMVALPWIMGSLAAQQGAINMHQVSQARYDAEQASQETQVIRDQMQTLFVIASALTATLKGEEVLQALLREAQKVVPYTSGLALIPTGTPGELSIVSGHNLSIVDVGTRVRVQRSSTIGAALYPPSNPQVIDDISQEPDLAGLSTLRTCHAACLIPLRVAVQVYGLVLVVRESNDTFTPDQVNILVALTSYATVALLNQELRAEVQKERLDMASAEDHARHWLAREIHDGLAQKLAAITMNTEFIRRQIQEDPAAAIAELDKIGELFKQANFDVRTLLGELKPTTLESQGLPAALDEYLKRLRTRYEHIQFQFEARGVSGLTLNKEARSTLFNIVQESVNNSLKYAEPKNIWVRMDRDGYRLNITIQDDGKGFNVEDSKAKAKARGSHGLSNLEDRARLIDGVTEIVSAPGKGATIRVTVPLEV